MRISKTFVLLPLLALPVHADILDHSRTVVGNGGLSEPISGFSDSPFWYINSGPGGVEWCTAWAALGDTRPCEPSLGYMDDTPTSGSMLLSSTITVPDGGTLSTTVSFLSNETLPIYDIAGVYLVRDELGIPIVTALYSQGVGGAVFLGNEVTLGDVHYGPIRAEYGPEYCPALLYYPGPYPPGVDPSCMLGGSTAWQTISYSPDEGQYRLLYYAYNKEDFSVETGLAVRSVEVSAVPESGPGLILTALTTTMILGIGNFNSVRHNTLAFGPIRCSGAHNAPWCFRLEHVDLQEAAEFSRTLNPKAKTLEDARRETLTILL